MLTSRGILSRRSIARKTRKRYSGPILSHITPAVSARMPLPGLFLIIPHAPFL